MQGACAVPAFAVVCGLWCQVAPNCPSCAGVQLFLGPYSFSVFGRCRRLCPGANTLTLAAVPGPSLCHPQTPDPRGALDEVGGG